MGNHIGTGGFPAIEDTSSDAEVQERFREQEKTMKAHFVEFLSPGTFVAESTTKPIAAWDVEAAKALARDIQERYGARPYGFRFLTRERGENDLDSKVTQRSGTYYLGGKIETIEDVRARALPDERILLSNMEGNKYDRIIVNDNSWRWTQPLLDGDTVLDFAFPAKADPDP